MDRRKFLSSATAVSATTIIGSSMAPAAEASDKSVKPPSASQLMMEDAKAASGSAKFFPLKGHQESMLQSEFGNQWEEIQGAMNKYRIPHPI